MRLFGLIGYPLGHSFSKKYFSEKFDREGIADARYELFPIENIAALHVLLAERPELSGLNVTIPHKQAVIPLLHALDETARAVGAVNCIRIKNGRLEGFNTDVTGFENSLRAIEAGKWTTGGTTALVLGTGGASRAVAFVLKKLGIPFRFVSRESDGENRISYEAMARIPSGEYHLLINTTPLGMAPNTDTCPALPFEQLSSQHLVYDLVYNPVETLLLQRAKARGCAVKNGLEMLHLQADAAWQIWNS